MKIKVAFCCARMNPYYDAVLRGAKEAVEREAAELLSWLGGLHVPLAALPYLKPDGLIVGPHRPEEVEQDPPKVGFSNVFKDTIRPAVVNDDRESGRMAAQAVAEAGYTHIGLLAQSGPWHTRLREEGLLEEAKRVGLSTGRLDMTLRRLEGSESFEDVWTEQQEAFTDFLRNLPDNSAVVSTGPGHAREALSLLTDSLGKRVPEETGVLVLDLPGEVDAALAHIQLDGEEVGRCAIRRLLASIRGETEDATELVRIPPRGVARGRSLRQGEGQRIYRRLRAWCELHLAEAVSVEDMGRVAGLSRRSLEMHLKKDGYPPPYELLTDLRVAEAKRLLRNTKRGMENIAEQCGFSDGRALRKRFIARTGQTPREWRKERS